MAVCFGAYALVYFGIAGFLPAFLVEAHGVPLGLAGMVGAAAAIANLCGNLAAARLMRAGIAPARIVRTIGVAMAVLAAASFALPLPAWGVIAVAVVASGIGGSVPASLFALVPRSVPLPALDGAGDGAGDPVQQPRPADRPAGDRRSGRGGLAAGGAAAACRRGGAGGGGAAAAADRPDAQPIVLAVSLREKRLAGGRAPGERPRRRAPVRISARGGNAAGCMPWRTRADSGTCSLRARGADACQRRAGGASVSTPGTPLLR